MPNLEQMRNGFPALAAEFMGLILDADKCVGCGICVVVCEENRMNDEVVYGKGGRYNDELVLIIEEGKVRLLDVKQCKRAFDPPEFCRACIDHCPTRAIEFLSQT